MKSLKKISLIFVLGILISILTAGACEPKYSSKYILENNSDSTLFLSLFRNYQKDSISTKLITNNWIKIPAHTGYKLGDYAMWGKLRDDQLMYFNDSLKLTLDTLAKIGVKKDMNNYSNWKRTILNSNTNQYTFSITTSEFK